MIYIILSICSYTNLQLSKSYILSVIVVVNLYVSFKLLVISLLVLLTPLSYGVVAGIGTLAISILGIKRYYSSIIEIKKLKKEIDSGKRNLDEEILIEQKEAERIKRNINYLNNSIKTLEKNIENIRELKENMEVKKINYKECLYETIEELLKNDDLDSLMEQKINKLESSTGKEKTYYKN